MPSRRLLISSIALASLVTACQRSQPQDEHMAHMAAGDLAPPTINASNSQGHDGLPASANTAQARLAASPRHGEWVTIPWESGSKDSIMAWIEYPTTSNPKTPVVVIVHEVYGLSTWVRSVADQVAAEGFIAIAPDFNSRVRGGPSTTEIPADSAVKLARLVSTTERNKGIAAAAKYAMSVPSAAPKYAVIGFCYGGSTVWAQAVNGGIPGYVGGVAFYGMPYLNGPNPDLDSLKKINKPIMLLSGAKDARIGAVMPATDSMMKSMNKWYYGNNYQGAVHGFMRAQDDQKAKRDEAEEQANLAAAKDAWPRTVAFLKTNLGVK
ncbi:MAG TPA: dienelactone hydrolase family protein [Gemmatimonadaceae bacterium]|jgi:carboxymethylenebutenolidase